MPKYLDQYRSLWQGLKGRPNAHAQAVGGDFEAIGKLEFEVLRLAGLQPDWSVVDVGCGSGRLAAQLAGWLNGPYLGTDILPDLLDHARRVCARPDWRFEATAGQDIPAPDDSADLVCFFSVLTHLTHEESWRYLLEAKRVAKPGGIIVGSFLEFRIRSHWAVFRDDVRDRTPNKVLNQFLSRDALTAFAFNSGLSVESFHDGDAACIPLDRELAFEDGRRASGFASLGQSVCIIRKPLEAVPLPL